MGCNKFEYLFKYCYPLSNLFGVQPASNLRKKLDLANHYILISRAKANMYVVAGSKRLAAREDTRPVFKLIASHCTCFDVQDDVLETTIGLATSRAGATWGKGHLALSIDVSGHCGCSR